MPSRIPPPLEPYLCTPLPHGALVLLTGILAATPNWLIIQYLDALLRHQISPSSTFSSTAQDEVVVLVSWLRDWDFWALEARKIANLDLTRLRNENHLIFYDSLSSTPKPTSIFTTLSQTLQSLQQKRIHLILDTPHILLATSPHTLTSQRLLNHLLPLRAVAYTTIITAPADEPFVRAAALAASALPTTSSTDDADRAITSTASINGVVTPLDEATAGFTVALAHQAYYVLSLRTLDTGFAADVSGVIRATRGGAATLHGEKGVEEGEWLYRVKGDGAGGVVVWRRGEEQGYAGSSSASTSATQRAVIS